MAGGPDLAAVRGLLSMLDGVNRAIYYLVGALLAVISGVVLFQVIVRFLPALTGINLSAPWTEELARFLLVWVIFLGAGVGCRKAQLIALEFVVRGLPRRPGQALRILALVLCLYLFWLLISAGYQFVVIIGRTELSPVMQISKVWVYWSMVVGGVLMAVNTLALMVEALVERRDIRSIGGIASTD